MVPEQGSRGLLVPRVQLDGGVGVPGLRRDLGAAQVVVGDDELGERAAGGDPGEGGTDSAGADQEYAHSGDPRPEVGQNQRDQS